MRNEYLQFTARLNGTQEIQEDDFEKLKQLFNDRWNPLVEVPLPPQTDGGLSVLFLLRRMDFAS